MQSHSTHVPVRGRRKPPESFTAEGGDQLSALSFPRALGEYGKPDHMAALERRLRLAAK